jgi:drug/metabolite transporter (DMT)-like permease
VVTYNLKKGVAYGSIGVVLMSLQPIIANARPLIIDPFIFAAITALLEAIIFLPIFLFERRKLIHNKTSELSLELKNSLLNGWKMKRNIRLLGIIGVMFSIVPVLMYIGFRIAGAINSTLTFKSEIMFALLFGSIFLKEKRISKIQIVFCIFLYFGLILAITEGSFNLLEFNLGVVILTVSVALFTLIHTFTKSGFDRNELFPTQVVFIRNLVSGIILFMLYILIFPIQNLQILFEFENFIFFLVMAIDYGFSLFLWYKTLTYIQIGKASFINSLTPVSTAVFSFLILGNILTIYHLVGTLIIIVSIYFIVREKKE